MTVERRHPRCPGGGGAISIHRLGAATLLLLAACWSAPSSLALPQGGIDPVLATVDRQVVTASDLDYFVLEACLYDETLWAEPLDRLRLDRLPAYVDELLLERYAFRKAQEPTPDEVSATVDAAWERYVRLAGSPQRLESRMEEMGLTAKAVRRWLEERSKRNWRIREVVTSRLDLRPLTTTSDSPANARRVWIAHIFIKPKVPSVQGWEDARIRATSIWLSIIEGFSFERAATVYTDDDQSRDRGGDLGWIARGALDPAIGGALERIQSGQVTSPVQTEDGFHIVRLLDYETSVRTEFAKALEDEERRILKTMRDETDIILAPGIDLPPVPDPSSPSPPGIWEQILSERERASTGKRDNSE